MSEQEIFDKHFGGIYYAFLRGTDGKTDKGIYAQTWKDYKTLEAAYENVKDLMKQGVK
jgi:exodeoxyribonuclease V beta subunit